MMSHTEMQEQFSASNCNLTIARYFCDLLNEGYDTLGDVI